MGTQLPHGNGAQQLPLSAHVYCGQTAGLIRIPLGMEAGLGPGDTVFDGDPAPPWKGAQHPPTFRPTLLWHGGPSQQLLSSCSRITVDRYTPSERHR